MDLGACVTFDPFELTSQHLPHICGARPRVLILQWKMKGVQALSERRGDFQRAFKRVKRVWSGRVTFSDLGHGHASENEDGDLLLARVRRRHQRHLSGPVQEVWQVRAAPCYRLSLRGSCFVSRSSKVKEKQQMWRSRTHDPFLPGAQERFLRGQSGDTVRLAQFAWRSKVNLALQSYVNLPHSWSSWQPLSFQARLLHPVPGGTGHIRSSIRPDEQRGQTFS